MSDPTSQRIKDQVDIVRFGHIEYLVRDLSRARDFYVNLIGMHITEENSSCVFLRSIEERSHHSLVLRCAKYSGVGHIAFKVGSNEELDRMAHRFDHLGLATRWVPEGEELGQGRALRMRDPLGFTVEYYHEMAAVPSMLQRFHLHRGVSPLRIDHTNVLVPDAHAGYLWYADELGFRTSEYTEAGEPGGRRWASWMFRKPSVHDIAVMTGRGPAVHHTGFLVSDVLKVIHACDILASAGYGDSIERGPARHGISNAFFVYIRDPDGNRFELFTGDYLTSDPDMVPLCWDLDDPQRQTFWGQPAPRRWFDEFMPIETLDGHGLMETEAPLQRAYPRQVS
jgi:catechol 2,3-dioxygenase